MAVAPVSLADLVVEDRNGMPELLVPTLPVHPSNPPVPRVVLVIQVETVSSVMALRIIVAVVVVVQDPQVARIADFKEVGPVSVVWDFGFRNSQHWETAVGSRVVVVARSTVMATTTSTAGGVVVDTAAVGTTALRRHPEQPTRAVAVVARGIKGQAARVEQVWSRSTILLA